MHLHHGFEVPGEFRRRSPAEAADVAANLSFGPFTERNDDSTAYDRVDQQYGTANEVRRQRRSTYCSLNNL